MPRGINPTRLANVIEQLQRERQGYQRRIDEIDQIFAQCGIAPTGGTPRARRGRPAGKVSAAAAPAGRNGRRRGGRGRKRGKFAVSGPQSIIDFVKNGGRGGVSSSDISKHWKAEGRAGEPYITLGHLVKSGKLKKKQVEGQRGSQYSVA